jgi:hypothetical protein
MGRRHGFHFNGFAVRLRYNCFMARTFLKLGVLLFLSVPLMAQGKRLWVLRAPGEMVEYDPATFASKQTVKVPSEALQSPQNLSVNHRGQMLFAAPVTLPLAEGDAEAVRKAWLWDGHNALPLDQGVSWKLAREGSNVAATESAPVPYLSADGALLFWFANSAHRLLREEVDLSTATTWQAWTTDPAGDGREDLVTTRLPECRCSTGSCEESCAYEVVWVPPDGVGKFFLLTQFVAGKTLAEYKDSARYQEQAEKWTAIPVTPPLHRVLDASPNGDVIVEAIPDTGCCGWVNQSNDQTVVRNAGKTTTVFDELATYKNPDYDVSFYTSNARLSPSVDFVAITIATTAQLNKPIQLAEQGQANPEESQSIRKAMAVLPAVEVKSLDDTPKRVLVIPHATLVGWISEKEILVVEDHLLIAVNVATGARRKSSIRAEDTAKVFLR